MCIPWIKELFVYLHVLYTRETETSLILMSIYLRVGNGWDLSLCALHGKSDTKLILFVQYMHEQVIDYLKMAYAFRK